MKYDIDQYEFNFDVYETIDKKLANCHINPEKINVINSAKYKVCICVGLNLS